MGRHAISSQKALSAGDLRPYLRRCGYTDTLLRPEFRFGDNQVVTLAAFARTPTDSRTACIVATNILSDLESGVAALRQLGAPVLLICHQGELQWWRQGPGTAELVEPISAHELDSFFQHHKHDFSPNAIYRAKTWGRFDRQHQLTFVDVGLMPVIERECGEVLGRLIERNVSALKSNLKWRQPNDAQGIWMLQSIFWLVAAKILADKEVGEFGEFDLTDVKPVFERVASHYGTDSTVGIADEQQLDALRACADDIARFSDLSHISSESLAYVYENTLISKEARRELGTHSTPPYLVDYVVGKLADWINEIPLAKRHVFEPACGHSAFLVSAMRLLRELRLDAGIAETPKQQHKYLQQRLHGCEIDPFALEIARLSLTLADIPNPNGWDLQPGDMFETDILQRQSQRAMILLANPPFEDFKAEEKAAYAEKKVTLQFKNKTAEMLMRTLPHLRPDAVFGVVVPQGLLHSKNATPLREMLAKQFEFREICLFADKVFQKGEPESAILLGRKVRHKVSSGHTFSFRLVREPDIDRFKTVYAVSSRRSVEQKRFSAETGWDFRVPELEEVWLWCRDYPTLGTFAFMGQGLFYIGEDSLPENAETISNREFSNAVRGFVKFDDNQMIHGLPTAVWMSLDPNVIDREVTGTTKGTSQVLLNYGRGSRGPWRLKALIDSVGHPVTNRIITVRSEALSLSYLWALLNSPFANAFMASRTMKKDVLVGDARKIPIPMQWERGLDTVDRAVIAYLSAVTREKERLSPSPDPKHLCRLLMQVDAEVLKLYDLPPRVERQLLDYFRGHKRNGVPFFFDRYYPAGYEPCFPLHEYLSDAYEQSTAGAMRDRHETATPEMAAAMEAAVDAFQE